MKVLIQKNPDFWCTQDWSLADGGQLRISAEAQPIASRCRKLKFLKKNHNSCWLSMFFVLFFLEGETTVTQLLIHPKLKLFMSKYTVFFSLVLFLFQILAPKYLVLFYDVLTSYPTK
jgi:hypothetical protein